MHDLYHGQFRPPPFPEKTSYRAMLRWLISVLDDDDQSLSFIAGCLSYCVKNDGITKRQSVGIIKVLKRVIDDFNHDQLDCVVNCDYQNSEITNQDETL